MDYPEWVEDEHREVFDAVSKLVAAVIRSTKADGGSAAMNKAEDMAVRRLVRSLGYKSRDDVNELSELLIKRML